ncbi:MAG: FAD-dependent oxidoreductase [Nitrospirae bacterium CG18_big_fil_WC_8_21_14_2_50_70_55]|nr:glycerol-3-phosphate dehydrogenase/oxidase [Deltaproteobacteria bacterium]OIP64171.1 MAG: hypothetical protein AUK30_07105 [Nitrospirae bacterium CG2_30_70_394]PIQ06626.1 MAG: FAD-dependent oxidoreductase [Nitrospirae bacterium CG18_big_fil_WC_8_21_14_2_50_70_55]PIU78407.1 MAG: glycerol-3-phosphate dehydrogenase/oxidase [Nitrospirae bacterium CG06_land_8_20_14_3_00_70_43]PIW84021.1 MAG: glycerol-3-phosphate dehydrogenase/oxidase [Nitrospirae bacterium CG_4_8_14_3_um_filter_70_85]PIX83607.1 
MRRDFDRLRDSPFDLLVVGGGIYGAWTALDGALRGLKVALVERDDWAAGTSSSSSKLIHGGLRYLQHFHFNLVHKSLAERRLLSTLAPHQIRPLRFLLPTTTGFVGRRFLATGLALYDLLAGPGQPVPGHDRLAPIAVAARYPYLDGDRLTGAFTYGDCGTDDARLTCEVVDGAWRAGAAVVNRARVEELLVAGGRVVGAQVTDGESGAAVEVAARLTVLAAGPWAEALLPAGVRARTHVWYTKGVHLVMGELPGNDALLLVARSDGRVFFVIPWYGRALVGTTDTAYHGDPSEVAVAPADIDYLLSELRAHAPGLGWDESSIAGSFAGLRTLQGGDGLSPSAVSREWRLARPLAGLLMPVGGKLTAARADAAKIVRVGLRLLGRPDGVSPTRHRPLPWAPPAPFASWLAEQSAASRVLGLDPETAHWAAHRFGTRMADLHALVRDDPTLARRLTPAAPFCRAEVVLAARDEMARGLEDALRRRMPATLLATLDAATAADAAALMGGELGWAAARQAAEVATFLRRG